VASIHSIRRLPLQHLALFVASFLLTSSSPASAQGSGSAIGNAVMALWNSNAGTGPIQTMNGRLYGAVVFAQVRNVDGDTRNLGATDQVLSFELRRPGGSVLLSFPAATLGTSRAAFTGWVTANAAAIVNALFPDGLSGEAAGRDITSLNTQQFLQNTVLGFSAPTRSRVRAAESGGLFEYDNFSGDDRSGFGIQGLYKTRWNVSFLGRFAQQHDNESPITPGIPVSETHTKATNFGADYHPSTVVNDNLDWHVGAYAHGDVFFAQATTLDFGSIDIGGGGWTSAHKDFERVRIGGGALFGGTKSHLPTSLLSNSEDARALADAFNDRAIQWDFSYGGIIGYALNDRTSLNGKALQTAPVESEPRRPILSMLMVSLSYLVGDLTPIDVGYKYATGGGVGSHSVFLQGNFSF
jgi:hypothetical protein